MTDPMIKMMRIIDHEQNADIPQDKAMLYVDDTGWIGTNNGEPFTGQPALYPALQAIEIAHCWNKRIFEGNHKDKI